jgi:hypothetical protein
VPAVVIVPAVPAHACCPLGRPHPRTDVPVEE